MLFLLDNFLFKKAGFVEEICQKFQYLIFRYFEKRKEYLTKFFKNKFMPLVSLEIY
jgi:hypothetical protein